MAFRARASTARTHYGDHYADDDLWPGERIGALPPRTGARNLLRLVVVVLLGLGGWAMLGEQAWQQAETAVSSWIKRTLPGTAGPASLATATRPPAKLPAIDAPHSVAQPPPSWSTTAPDPAARSEPAPLTTAAIPQAATSATEANTPWQPPAPDPADPLQMRAVAVGLHPDLSRVLLARLSDTDYRNAGVAIQTALAETPDSGVFVWPRQRKPELALFQVRFVPGAAPGCRRYVVAVTKDGWLTTALPMEKCGSPTASRPRRE